MATASPLLPTFYSAEAVVLRMRRLTGCEWAAVVLLPFGGFLLGIGWFVGVKLLWASPSWTRSEKLLGTLVPVGGVMCPLWLLARASPSFLWGVLTGVTALAAFLVPLWLALRARYAGTATAAPLT